MEEATVLFTTIRRWKDCSVECYLLWIFQMPCSMMIILNSSLNKQSEAGSWSPRLVCLLEYDFVQYDFFGAVAYGIHPAHPAELICAFKCLCDAFRCCVLPDEWFKHFRCRLVDLFEIPFKRSVHTHYADGWRAVLLKKLIVPKAPYSDVTDVQIHFLDLRFSIWFVLLEIEIRIVEINDKSEPFANRLWVRICTVWCEYW